MRWRSVGQRQGCAASWQGRVALWHLNIKLHAIATHPRGPSSPLAVQIGEDIAKETAKEWKGLRVTVKLTVQNRQAKVSVIPSAAALVIKALKEPVRDRKKVRRQAGRCSRGERACCLPVVPASSGAVSFLVAMAAAAWPARAQQRSLWRRMEAACMQGSTLVQCCGRSSECEEAPGSTARHASSPTGARRLCSTRRRWEPLRAFPLCADGITIDLARHWFPSPSRPFSPQEKNIKHNGNLALDDIYEIARIMADRSCAANFSGTVKEMLGTCVSGEAGAACLLFWLGRGFLLASPPAAPCASARSGPLPDFVACRLCRTVGCTVEHEDPRDIQKKIDDGEIVW